MTVKPSYKELEQKVRRLEKEAAKLVGKHALLREGEERYRNLFEHMLHEVHLWKLVRDASGTIITWRLVDANPAALKSWGRSLSEIVGKTTEEIFSNPNSFELFMPVVQKIFSEGKPYTWEYFFPGTNQFLHMISIPLGELFISTGMDISDRR